MTRLCYPTKTLRYDQDADGERPQSRDGKDAHNPDQTYRRPSRTLVDMPASLEAGRTWLKVRNATQRQRNPREYDMAYEALLGSWRKEWAGIIDRIVLPGAHLTLCGDGR